MALECRKYRRMKRRTKPQFASHVVECCCDDLVWMCLGSFAQRQSSMRACRWLRNQSCRRLVGKLRRSESPSHEDAVDNRDTCRNTNGEVHAPGLTRDRATAAQIVNLLTRWS